MIAEFKKLSFCRDDSKENQCLQYGVSSATIERELHENRLSALFCLISTQHLAQCVAESENTHA